MSELPFCKTFEKSSSLVSNDGPSHERNMRTEDSDVICKLTQEPVRPLLLFRCATQCKWGGREPRNWAIEICQKYRVNFFPFFSDP